ncbi:hypothetical protein CPU12_07030 [Malaciobacter molluscorum LMG 25693]|uniref:Thioredoxin-like fold domain-containing protein n=1 Tax=Malaciobacter molluscorum LMG 25693 TaxID=870501 RepID=A0A2G1DIB7_9BACT|nr:hypothetical protein [Malaciobacter molluscorum]AXX92337.1 hypothetical protein AMOL_1362 [Malaciobacter molluscorum LMG 25693]PHO18211.1 hypothetical protein CPU12_07030 [Malaciobacter molluscorum LMG 25693]
MKNLILLTIFAIAFSFAIYYNENFLIKITKQEKPLPLKKINSINNRINLYFKDNSKIILNDKDSIIFFLNNTNKDSIQLKEFIINSKIIQQKLTKEVNSYYININENKKHTIFYKDEKLNIDSKTMLSLYNIDTVPTLIFLDMNNKEIFSLIGKLGEQQLIATLNFIKDKLYKNKDRKSGEVYNSLIEYYKKNAITIENFIK